MVYHNSQSGTAKLYYTTFCSGNTFVTSDFFAYVPPGGGGGCDEPLPVAYPNPATDLLTVDLPCEEQLYSSMQIEDNGSFKTIETSRDGNQYSIDVSSLKPGLHILRFKKEHGKAQYIRFMKSK